MIFTSHYVQKESLGCKEQSWEVQIVLHWYKKPSSASDLLPATNLQSWVWNSQMSNKSQEIKTDYQVTARIATHLWVFFLYEGRNRLQLKGDKENSEK